ncbi:related to kinesin light chain 1 [Phialocephala subalpina]|uniref:Related to kinesin light chain 1 n=1 Tax=Phialocephala subalpina TaxID=576137 RepID=A0A1L7WEY1_9HELO|nr:related to kinesin light chain 1 [Phialocephala subalpina]
MRLLEIKGPGEFSLVQVATHNTLPYAILSHTWVHGQEVTYRDLVNGTGDGKTGYEKIKFCGEQATKDGLQHFWVDTCCIDKSDSTELTTAINSMFRWYRNAKKCYVYLADVSTPGDDADVQAKQSIWEAAFRDSKWFTRGWTLQELIAPATVEFFSQEGKRLGDKNSLEKLIHKITSIPIQALQGNPFSHFSIAERREWAVQRRTTEEEDIVYCLLGLCEVSMPPIYGEGKEAALKRLQMTVREFSKDSSEPKDLEDNMAPFIVPFDRNPNFTGRGTELAKAEEKLFGGSQTTKVAIWGLGGVGKTQLMLELVYRIKDKYKNCSVIWIPATNTESLYQMYLDIARQLGIPAWEDKEVDVKKLVQEYLSKDNAGQWLLVFDNADDIDMWIAKPGSGSGSGSAQESGGLIDYLPRSKQGSIVFTTRDRKAAVKLAQENIVEVQEMNEELSVLLLQKCLVNPDLVKKRQDATALLTELTYLPLAIVQAAAYINENGITLAEYLLLLEGQEEELIDLLSEEFQDSGRYRNVKNPVATTWLISFEQIRRRDALAADYLSFMCCIDPKDIPQSLLPPGPSRKKEIEAIGTLNAYSFITKRAADLTLHLHRLVHLSMRNWLRKENLLTRSTEEVITRLQEVFPDDDDHKNRSVWRTYLPHARYVLESNLVGKEWQSRMDLIWRYGMCLFEDGRWNEAEAAITEVLEIEKRDLGADHPSTLISMANLASTYRNQGRWDEAEELEVRVMETSKTKLGADHPSTLISMANLALTYKNQGRWDEAEELEVRVMETRKTKLGVDHLDTLISIDNLASTYRNQGRWDEAEELQVQVIETSKTKLGADHLDTLISMANLASTYRGQGRWDEAEELQVQVIETSKTKIGADHPNTLIGMANLASTYMNQKRWDEAEELQMQVIETRKIKLGADHPDTLICIADLASTYWNQGRWDEAEELQVQVMETNKTKLGADHPFTLTSMNNLAIIWKGNGRDTEALKLMQECITLRARILGTNHPNTLSSRTTLLKWQGEKLEISASANRE